MELVKSKIKSKNKSGKCKVTLLVSMGKSFLKLGPLTPHTREKEEKGDKQERCSSLHLFIRFFYLLILFAPCAPTITCV
jgi:hypothetical protein